jgi:uncharacterized membrane protein YkoI
MTLRSILALLLASGGLAIGAGGPVRAGVEDQVRGMVQAGEILPFDAIQNRVRSQMPGDYIGADFDATTRTYRFRFLVNGNVINVDVDARTGQRVRRSNSY